MHCHLGFMENGEEVAASALADGALLFANTVTPGEWMPLKRRFADFPNIAVGFGMHPWWVGANGPDGSEADIMQVLHDEGPRFIGEVGLDFSSRHAHTRDAQLRAFKDIATWSANQGERLISIHSVKAAGVALDILEDSGAMRTCTCIFHWFSGSGTELKRAIDAGCYFSCGQRMLAHGKGREYVKAIPARRLLLETDAPPGQGVAYSYAELKAELQSAAQSIAALKGPEALDIIAETSMRLLQS